MKRINEAYLPEIEADEISLSSFEPQEELNPKFWVNGKINSNVRIRLLEIAEDFLDDLAVDWVKPNDIVITGSIANYNWSKYSDVDVHILMDYNKVWEKTEFVEDYFKDKKELWADCHPNLKIYGFPVEVYVEDINGECSEAGIYSLVKNKWLKKPIDLEDTELNADYIKNYSAQILTKIDDLFEKLEKEENTEKLNKYSKQLQLIFDKLKNLRKESLKKYGEMGSGNIIWKVCRRLGYLEKLWDVVNSAYDKAKSLG